MLRGAERFFERPEVREAVSCLRGAARGGEEADRARCRDDVAATSCRPQGWDPALPPAGGASRERWESLAALVRLAEDLAAARPEAGLRRPGPELDERAAAQHAPTVEGVTLASLHAAKGLEWDAVFLVGLVEGTLPIIHADDRGGVEEERRLLYVGVTRAREHLSLSWARGAHPGAVAATASRSRFLDGPRARPTRPTAAAARRRRRQSAGRARGRSSAARPAARLLVTAADRKRGRCDDCPPGLRRGVLRPAAGVAARAVARRLGPGVRRLHRRDPRGRSPYPASRSTRRAGRRSAASGAVKLERYGDAGARPRRRTRDVSVAASTQRRSRKQ